MQLQPASWTLVPVFLKMLKRHWPDTKSTYSVLKGFSEHRLKFPDFVVHFLTPGGTINNFATLVLYIPRYPNNLYIESFNPDIEPFVTAIENCTYIDYTELTTFACMHPRLWPIFESICNKKGFKIVSDCRTFSYHISNEDATALNVQIPEDVYLDKLTSQHAEKVNAVWPHGSGERSIPEVIDYITLRPAFGLFKKDTKELISWCLYIDYGGVGLLHVDDKFKRRGYGSAILVYMTNYLGLLGIEPQAFILNGNEASVALFEKYGYKRGARSRWVEVIEESRD